jgi:uncharacterized protein (DUF1778 family)
MAGKIERLEVWLTSTQHEQIEQAAALAGESVSSFVVLAALDRAETFIGAETSTVVSAAYFDELVASLDKPAEAPGLARPAREVHLHGRIKGT